MIPAVGRRPEEPAAPRSGPPRMLVADDAAPVRRTLQEILHKLGLPQERVLLAGGPEEALDLFRRERPHVVLTEFLGVHNEDGLDVIHEMLNLDPQAKIVLVTSEPRDAPEVRAALRAGVFAYVEKPLRHEKIRAVIADLQSEEGGVERFR